MSDILLDGKVSNKQPIRDIGYDFIRFTAMILIHHLFTTFREFGYKVPDIWYKLVARDAIEFGGVGVALFFILSGTLLIKKYKENLEWKDFYYKKFIRIECAQWIGFITAFALTYCVYSHIINYDFLGILISFLGMNYSGVIWSDFGIQTVWVIGEWFTAVIIICYALFPLLRSLFNKSKTLGTIIIGTIFLLNLKFEILTYGNGWFSITNGIMCFWCGMLFEEYKSYISKLIIHINYLFIVVFIYINPPTICGAKYLSCFIFSLALFVALYQIKYSNLLTQYVCKYNYELYLVHHRIYILFLPALLNKSSNGIQIFIASIFMLFLSSLAAQALHKATNFTIEHINNYKQAIQNRYKGIINDKHSIVSKI